MNSYQTGNTVQKSFNGTANRPMGINPPEGMNPNYMNMPQMRPRMDAPNINTNQQQMQQQNSINPNYQQRPRFPEGGGLNRVQPNPAGDVRNFRPNDSYQNQNLDDAQKNLGNNSDSKMYSAQQQRFSNPPQVRPPFNDAVITPKPGLNQTANPPRNTLPSQETSALRNQNLSNPPNLKPGSEPMLPENYKNEQKSGAMKNEAMKPLHQTLSRRDSSLEMASNVTLNNSQKINENNLKKDIENDIDKNEKTNTTVNKVEIDQLQPTAETVKNEQQQPLTQTADNTKNEQQKPVTQTNDLEKTNSNQNENSKQPKKNIKKETNNDEDSVTKGLVHKNIQYFEEKDTAKTPLLPKTTINEKDDTGITKKTKKVDVIESTKESGVDETPMIHPNLRSIYQEPYKVVKIGQFRSGKHKPRILKKQSRTVFENNLKKKSLLHHSHSIHLYNNVRNYSQNKRFLNKKQKTQMFTPEEELLAFFHNSKEMRKIKFDDSQKRSRSASRNRVASKPTANGDITSSKKTPTKLPSLSNKNPTLSSPTKTPLKSPGTPGSKITPKTPETPSPPTPLIKKVPMNKIQVGAAPSPNLKAIRSKVGSLANTTHKPGGGNIKIESHKVDFSKAQPRIEAKNEQYTPSGGDKKIQQVKLQWSAKSKVGSLENATYKPGGGDKKIESVKLDFKEKAKPKVGSKDNVKHVPGGGCVKIENQKLEFKAQSKVGSLDNVKHKPGGGEIKIFDDKTYLKQISGNSSEGRASGAQSFGDLSVVREIEGRSAPNTPGRRTAIQIKKTTTIKSSDSTPILKNITEVKVASQTPKKRVTTGESSSKQQVKLTYSKLSSPINTAEIKESVEVVTTPAKDGPVLKPSLTNKDASNLDKTGRNLNGNYETIERSSESSRKLTDFDKTHLSKEIKNSENLIQTSGFSNLQSGGKLMKDPELSGLSQVETATHHKVGEIWKETNNLKDDKSALKEQQQKQQDFNTPLTDYRIGGSVTQLRSQYSVEPPNKTETSRQNFTMNPNLSETQKYYTGQSDLRSTETRSNYQASPFAPSQP